MGSATVLGGCASAPETPPAGEDDSEDPTATTTAMSTTTTQTQPTTDPSAPSTSTPTDHPELPWKLNSDATMLTTLPSGHHVAVMDVWWAAELRSPEMADTIRAEQDRRLLVVRVYVQRNRDDAGEPPKAADWWAGHEPQTPTEDDPARITLDSSFETILIDGEDHPPYGTHPDFGFWPSENGLLVFSVPTSATEVTVGFGSPDPLTEGPSHFWMYDVNPAEVSHGAE